MAVRTASSNRSNSASPMTRSHIRECSVAKVFCFQIEAITQIVSIERPRQKWLLMSYVTEANTPPRRQFNVRKITFSQLTLAHPPRLHRRLIRRQSTLGNTAMTHRFTTAAVIRRGNPVLAFGFSRRWPPAPRHAPSSQRPSRRKLHARRLSSVRRRDPECEGDHRLPAAAEGQCERSRPGGVRAVREALESS